MANNRHIQNLQKQKYFTKQNSSCEILIYNKNKNSTVNGTSVKKLNNSYTRVLSKGQSCEVLAYPTRLSQSQKYSNDKKVQNNEILTENMQINNNNLNNEETTTTFTYYNNSNLTRFTESRNKQALLQNKYMMPHAKTTTNNSNNKINLNIILPQNMCPLTESDIISSDIESSSEGTPEAIILQETQTQTQRVTQKCSRISSQGINNNTNNKSKETEVSAAPLMLERPRLVRAMSAPVRPTADNFKNNKRKTRRRKLATQSVADDKLVLASQSKPTDVETLVSLVSSDGSDSEKEEDVKHETTSNRYGRRAPSLKKTGKSVSFQESSSHQSFFKENAYLLRRGSVVPILPRVRVARTPSASLFSREFKPLAVEPVAKPLKAIANNTQTEPIGKEIVTNVEYPSYVSTIKEQECWKLYQKMLDKGITVSFETILRGMLTPTEFRHSQKQRELEEAKALLFTEENTNSNENTIPYTTTCSQSLKVANLLTAELAEAQAT